MAKYKKTECHYCNRAFKKRVSDFNRTENEGRHHFCSLRCAAIYGNKTFPRKNLQKLNKEVDKS